MQDDPDRLPGCFGCLGDIGPLALVLILIAFAAQRSDAAVHADDAVPPPLQICAPIAPSGGAPDIPPLPDVA